MSVVAVTGASGFLGRPLCLHLARRGMTVRALVRRPEALAGSGFAAYRCDLPDTLDETALAGADAVIHAAYATRTTDPGEQQRVNEDGTRRVLEAARRAGVARFVFISTIAAHPDAPNYYARSKHALEQRLDPARDLVVRPGLILARGGHGLFQQMVAAARGVHLIPLFGGGREPLQTVHIDDVCEAIARALERDLTGALNVAEPDPPSLAEFLRLLRARLGVRCLLPRLPFAPMLALVRTIERLGLPFPLRSESMLGIRALRRVEVADDLRRLGMTVRSAAQSLETVI